MQVTLTGSGFAAVPSSDEAEPDPVFALQLSDENDASRELRLVMVLPDEWHPHLPRGQKFSMTWYEDERGALLPPALGLVIRDKTGKLVYLLNVDEAVPPDQTPEGLTLNRSPSKAFATTLTTQSGCMLRKQHHFLDVDDGRRKVTLAPGEARTLRSAAGYFRIVLFDYSLSSDELECLVESPPHFSYVIEAVPDED